jgi:hypothetical protein
MSGTTRRMVSALYFIALAVFVVWYVGTLDFAALAGTRPSVPWLLLASAIGLCFRYWGVYTWRAMLRGLGADDPGSWNTMSYVYAKAWLGRYLPGKVGWILGKVYFGTGLGIARERLAVGALIEAVQQVAVTLLLALALLALDERLAVLSLAQRMLLLGVAVAMLLGMHPVLFNAVIRRARRFHATEGAVHEAVVTSRTLLTGGVLQAVGFLLTGLSYVAFTKAWQPAIGAGDVPFVMGAFNLAGAVGILAIVAPSGLGVREGMQMLLLPLVMPKELAFVVTVAARVWSTVIDLLFFVVAWVRARSASAD